MTTPIVQCVAFVELNGYPGFLSSSWFSAENAGLLRSRLRLLILREFGKQVGVSYQELSGSG